MRLVRYISDGEKRLGAVKGSGIVDLKEAGIRATRIIDLAAASDSDLRQMTAAVDKADICASLDSVRLLAPIERPGKFLAIGMNYTKHADEAKKLGVEVPEHQVWFNKQTSCINGPFDDIEPGVTQKLDYEVELGVVIGQSAKNVSLEQAKNHVFGYFVANDVSARDYQFHTSTFTMGKSFDTHGPIGPCIVTRDEIADPHSLDLRCFVNGELRQQNNTRNLTHNIWQQIEYLSSAFTLEPGDLLATGTPEGVGIGLDPPSFLRAGDVIRCEIDQIGAIENRVTSEA